MRHACGGPGKGHGALLHHQGAGQGNGPGTLDRPQHGPGAPGPDPARQRARPRNSGAPALPRLREGLKADRTGGGCARTAGNQWNQPQCPAGGRRRTDPELHPDGPGGPWPRGHDGIQRRGGPGEAGGGTPGGPGHPGHEHAGTGWGWHPAAPACLAPKGARPARHGSNRPDRTDPGLGSSWGYPAPQTLRPGYAPEFHQKPWPGVNGVFTGAVNLRNRAAAP